jgi:hypothetical protein
VGSALYVVPDYCNHNFNDRKVPRSGFGDTQDDREDEGARHYMIRLRE